MSATTGHECAMEALTESALEPERAVAEVRDLEVRIPTLRDRAPAWVHALNGVDLTLRRGRVHGLVGESGCGKSMLGAALAGLLPPGARSRGILRIGGDDVLDAPEQVWRRIRGHRVGLVGQSAATGLTPTRTVGAQLAETLAAVGPFPRRAPAAQIREAAETAFQEVGLTAADLEKYPHELSGGMANRAMIAFALAADPEIVVADEPTAGLDPALTDHVLALLSDQAQRGVAVLLITHDLAGLARTGVADDVSVMYAGSIVEHGPAARVLTHPDHLYSRALLRALPRNGLHRIPGSPPSLVDLTGEVRFEDRLACTG